MAHHIFIYILQIFPFVNVFDFLFRLLSNAKFDVKKYLFSCILFYLKLIKLEFFHISFQWVFTILECKMFKRMNLFS